jgi:class 3 adenylate cyclase
MEMFVGIRGFTALSADNKASDVLQLFSDFYAVLVETIGVS